MIGDFEKPVIFRIILAFFIATFVFVGIFLIANSIPYLNYQTIINQNNIIQQSINESRNHLMNFVCETEILLEVSDKLGDVGTRLEVLEKRFGKEDWRVLEEKKKYSLLEYEHFEYIKKFSEDCDKEFITILFFYSNFGVLEGRSEGVSYILDSLRKKYSGKVMVYSFDYNLDLDLINELKEKYQVDSAPKIVVNEEKVFYLENIEELEYFMN